ncbi:MAG: recombinase family protein, partial [Bacteroidales bacterium]|nr:recombinase family protein [Bacteroidales bacterium]MCF8406076.1 recombinase family protein [Bacteroidales bacterium]
GKKRCRAPPNSKKIKKYAPKNCTLCSGMGCTLYPGLRCTLYSEILNLEQFKRLRKKKEVVRSNNKEVWCYIRVSSQEQKDNYSLENQKAEAKRFAESKGYSLVNFFEEVESAKQDTTRKEFSRLFDDLRKTKRKPYAIIVFKMNRFSRSGGSSIALAVNLINNYGVHLIETESGIDTTTDKGKNEVFRRLIMANEENLTRLDHTIPGMKALLNEGKSLGVSPFGYDHFGPRVNKFAKKEVEQRIVLNQTGKVLRQAWVWKVEGEQDSVIIKRLKTLGVDISKQKISAMWRNMFYCGLISNSLLDDIVKGQHEPMVDRGTFLKVQKIVEMNKQGYKIDRDADDRPLQGTLICPICNQRMTGYLVRKKGRHYYKCGKCLGVSINADTSDRMKKNIGAHNLFVEVLNTYQLDEKYLDLFKLQLKRILSSTDMVKKNEEAIYTKQLTELKNKKDKLEERFAFGEIEQSLYDKFLCQIDGQIEELDAKYDFSGIDTSNLKINLNKAVEFTQNVSKYWVSGNLDHKKKIQKLMFPEGIRIDTQKRQYLTSKVNALFSVKRSFTRNTKDSKKEKPTEIGGLSSLVAGAGLEPTSASWRI